MPKPSAVVQARDAFIARNAAAQRKKDRIKQVTIAREFNVSQSALNNALKRRANQEKKKKGKTKVAKKKATDVHKPQVGAARTIHFGKQDLFRSDDALVPVRLRKAEYILNDDGNEQQLRSRPEQRRKRLDTAKKYKTKLNECAIEVQDRVKRARLAGTGESTERIIKKTEKEMGLPHVLNTQRINSYVQKTTVHGPSIPLQKRGRKKHPQEELIFAAAANLVQVKQLAVEPITTAELGNIIQQAFLDVSPRAASPVCLLQKFSAAYPEHFCFDCNYSSRSHRRSLWQTPENLSRWYDGFQQTLVDEGFGIFGPPHLVELTTPKGNQIFGESTLYLYPGQHKRIINADETNVGGNAKYTKRTNFVTSAHLPNLCGQNRSTEASHITYNGAMCMPEYQRRSWKDCPASVAADAELLPPQFILSTTGDPRQQKPSKKLRQDLGKDTVISYTKTGSALRHTLDQFLDMVRKRFPDMENVPLKRVLLKIDGGPALPKDPDWLNARREEGFVIFLGLPNSTGVNQVTSCQQVVQNACRKRSVLLALIAFR